jgi:hypothetical protein
MAKWVHADVLDGGLNAIKNNANSYRLIKNYAAGDSYATVNGNSIAAVAMVSGDYTLGSSGSNRTLTVAAGKTAAASGSSVGGDNLHLAFVDTVNSKVLWVTDETTDQVITAGNTVNFPAPVYTSQQPT